MFRCFWIKRSLGEYIEGALGDSAKSRLDAHLKKCAGCQKTLLHLEIVARLAFQKKASQMSEEFWKKFDFDLDVKLDERLRTGFGCIPKPSDAPLRFLRRPAFAIISLTAIVLGVGLRVLSLSRHDHSIQVAQSEESGLVGDIELLDEFSQDNGNTASLDEDDVLELEMFYALDYAPLEEAG